MAAARQPANVPIIYGDTRPVMPAWSAFFDAIADYAGGLGAHATRLTALELLAAHVGEANVRDYGAVGNGVADDTAAIQAALNTGRPVYVPLGNYKVSGLLTLATDGQVLRGAGVGSALVTSSATAVILRITAGLVHVRDLTLNASVARTAGAYIDIVNVGYAHIHDMLLQNMTHGIRLAGSQVAGVRIHDITMNLGHGTGAGIEVKNAIDTVISDVLISGTSAGVQMASAVTVTNCGDLMLRHVSSVYAGSGLVVAPGAADVVQYLVVEGCLFDTGSGAGINVQAAGLVQSMKVANTWACSNTAGGIILNTTGAGVVQQTDIINTITSNNGLHGILINAAAVTGTSIIGSSGGANTGSGVWIAAGCNRFRVVNSTYGIGGQFIGNSQYGLTLGAGCTEFLIEGNTFEANGAGSLLYSAAAGAFGEDWRIANNLGFVTATSGVMGTTAGPTVFSVTHRLGVAPPINAITLTPLSGLGAASSYYVSGASGTVFDITFNVAPGAGVSLAWQARTHGG
jgi:hypothetical protein